MKHFLLLSDQFNASLLNKSINVFKIHKIYKVQVSKYVHVCMILKANYHWFKEDYVSL